MRKLLPLFIALALLGMLWALIAATPRTVHAAPAAVSEDGTRDIITPTTLNSSPPSSATVTTLGTSSGDGQAFNNTGKTFVVISSTYSTSVTATFVTPGTTGGQAIADFDVPIAAGARTIAGPFAVGLFNQTTGTYKNKVFLNWSAPITGSFTLSVTVSAFTLN